jgi:hypothetical protein
MKLRPLIVVMLVTLIPMLSVSAESQPKADAAAKRADIKRMIEITGASKIALQIMRQMIAAFKKDAKGVPDQFWDDFMAEVDPNELVDLYVLIYDKHFTHDDIKQLIKFYETPVGQKLIKSLPAITQESMSAGMEWGQRIARKVRQRLEEKGYKT